jgi:hypothetical protein
MATVLVVDDDSGVRELVVILLRANGHNVLGAANGVEALMVYSSYRNRLDLVLTDIDMPQMNGIELVSRIRTLDPSRRIILMSGRPLDNAKRVENCPMLSKPFTPDQLRAAVDGALDAGR